MELIQTERFHSQPTILKTILLIIDRFRSVMIDQRPAQVLSRFRLKH